MLEWGGGTGELRACVLVLQFSTSSVHVLASSQCPSWIYRDWRLQLKIPAQEFLIALLPSPKAFIYLKASLCPLWPHLAICCTCHGFSLIWPNWNCCNPVWDLISTMNLEAPACTACQMLWVVSYPVHYSHFQEKKK